MHRWISPATPVTRGSRSCTLTFVCRRAFLASSFCLGQGKPYTAEEDDKISELLRQGWSAPRIAKHLGRSYYSLTSRKRHLSRPKSHSSGRPWTSHELSILHNMRQNGSTAFEILAHLPGRSISAIHVQWSARERATHVEDPRQQSWSQQTTTERAQEVAILRAYEGKSFTEIATIFGTSTAYVCHLWKRHSLKLVPEDVRRSIRRSDGWTAEMDQRMVDLHLKGLTLRELVPHFPGKSYAAIQSRRMSLEATQRKRSYISRVEAMALREALKPVAQGISTITEVVKAFPQYSQMQIKTQLRRVSPQRRASPRQHSQKISRVEAMALREALVPVSQGSSTFKEVAQAFPQCSEKQISWQLYQLRAQQKSER